MYIFIYIFIYYIYVQSSLGMVRKGTARPSVCRAAKLVRILRNWYAFTA